MLVLVLLLVRVRVRDQRQILLNMVIVFLVGGTGRTGGRVMRELLRRIFRPDATRMANVAHFMADLVTKPEVWNEWKGRMPVIINEPAKA